MLNVPLYACTTLPLFSEAAPMLVADRFKKAEIGVRTAASICVIVTETSVPVIVVDPNPLLVAVIGLSFPTWPKVKMVVALAVAANKASVQSRSKRFSIFILHELLGRTPSLRTRVRTDQSSSVTKHLDKLCVCFQYLRRKRALRPEECAKSLHRK